MSAFGFGGTNFHAVLEEYVPGRLRPPGRRVVAVGADLDPKTDVTDVRIKAPLRGALVLGGADEAELAEQLRAVLAEAEAGRAPEPEAPMAAALAAPERIAIDYGDAAELADKATRALDALAARWRGLEAPPRPRASSAGAAPPARSRSSTPAKARSTPTCWPPSGRASPSSPPRSRKPTR